MRKREKQRIFKRFMDGESIRELWESLGGYTYYLQSNIEQAIRECVLDEIKKGEK